MPRCRHCRIAGQVSLCRRRARIRRVPELQDRRARPGASSGLSQRRRHLLRERRRRRLRGGAQSPESRRPHPVVRDDFGVQRDGKSRRAQPAAAARQPGHDQGIHRQRPRRSRARVCGGVRAARRVGPPQVPRGHRRRSRARAGSVHGPARGAQLRQADRARVEGSRRAAEGFSRSERGARRLLAKRRAFGSEHPVPTFGRPTIPD